MWHAPFSVWGTSRKFISFSANHSNIKTVIFCFATKRISSTDSFVVMSSAIDDIHNFSQFFSLNSKNIGGVIPKVKSTKIMSADDVVTPKKVGQKYDIVQKYDNIRFYHVYVV